VGQFLGHGYEVRASVGHVRDLLRSKLSVDLEDDFKPTYRVPDDKREIVKSLRLSAANASQIYLATDPDREGEAIAWHLLEAAQIPPERTHRVVFHEITKGAISDAFAHSRDIDMQLVDAQQARRILDRLVGYQVSPLLWERVKGRLSAGRVQSVAVRLIVEREREITAFVPAEYWTLDAELAQQSTRDIAPRPSFLARLIKIDGREASLSGQADASTIVQALTNAIYVVTGVKKGERRRRPYPPFTTSTLQQDAAARLGMTASRAMRIAQELYEGIEVGAGEGPVGLITYMRTDSVNVAREAAEEAKGLIREMYGAQSLPAAPNVFRSRAKNAQEAHEAIRPTSVRRLPDQIRSQLSRDQARLYDLIWRRFMASQMAPALFDTVVVDVAAGQDRSGPLPYLFRARGSVMRFPGFLAVYAGGASGPSGNLANGGETGSNGNGSDASVESLSSSGASTTPRELAEQDSLPELSEGELLDLLRLLPAQHFTEPPPRFSEASLIKELEENGIGRPSTYAAIISTILDRGYVDKSEKRLRPTELGFTVNDLLVRHFDAIFNVGFTSEMEESLDDIASGQKTMTGVLHEFNDQFAPQLRQAQLTMERVEVPQERTGETCPDCGGNLVIKQGRFGKFVGCDNYPTCRHTEPLLEKLGVRCPRDGGELVERRTKRGRVFYGCANFPQCDFTSWKRPLAARCSRCGGLMVVANRQWAECTDCHERAPLASSPEESQGQQARTA
jgi:DNA topoisomerase-1